MVRIPVVSRAYLKFSTDILCFLFADDPRSNSLITNVDLLLSAT